jgi:hypothetical protein
MTRVPGSALLKQGLTHTLANASCLTQGPCVHCCESDGASELCGSGNLNFDSHVGPGAIPRLTAVGGTYSTTSSGRTQHQVLGQHRLAVHTTS